MSHEETPREFTATITFVHGEKPFAVGASVGTSRTAEHIQRQNGDIYIPLNSFTVPRGQLAVGDRVSGLMVPNPAANARNEWRAKSVRHVEKRGGRRRAVVGGRRRAVGAATPAAGGGAAAAEHGRRGPAAAGHDGHGRADLPRRAAGVRPRRQPCRRIDAHPAADGRTRRRPAGSRRARRRRRRAHRRGHRRPQHRRRRRRRLPTGLRRCARGPIARSSSACRRPAARSTTTSITSRRRYGGSPTRRPTRARCRPSDGTSSRCRR